MGGPRHHGPKDAPKPDPVTVRCCTDSPSLDVWGHEAWRSLGLQSSASMSRRCAQQQQQQHVDDIAPQHARSSPTMVGSSPERRTPAACASLPACQLITADDTRSPSSCQPAHPVSWLAALLASPRLAHVRPIAQVPRGQSPAPPTAHGKVICCRQSLELMPSLPFPARSLTACWLVFRALRSLHVLLSGR